MSGDDIVRLGDDEWGETFARDEDGQWPRCSYFLGLALDEIVKLRALLRRCEESRSGLLATALRDEITEALSDE